MKKILLLFILILTLVPIFKAVEAKLLPRFKNRKSTSFSTSAVTTSVKLRSDRKALNLVLGNLNKTKDLTYTLIYKTDGRDEGVSGSIDLNSGNSASRELLFGTCSSGVCRYHANITSMRLEVITTLLNGKKTLKRFKIRV